MPHQSPLHSNMVQLILKRTQEFLSTVQDGIVSNQLTVNKTYLQNAQVTSWKFLATATNVSLMVKALQKLIGDTETGIANENTVKKLQEFLNSKGNKLSVDGKMGSLTVKAWQNYLNSEE